MDELIARNDKLVAENERLRIELGRRMRNDAALELARAELEVLRGRAGRMRVAGVFGAALAAIGAPVAELLGTHTVSPISVLALLGFGTFAVILAAAPATASTDRMHRERIAYLEAFLARHR